MMDIYFLNQKADALKQKTNAAASGIWTGVKSVLDAITDGAIYRTMLISFGVLIGTMFSDFLKKHRAFVACITLASAVLMLYRILSELERE